MCDHTRLLVLTVLACTIMSPNETNADTIGAASCSQEDVQKAIDAARDGDTVAIPAGTATWVTKDGKKPAVPPVRLRSRSMSGTIRSTGKMRTFT